MSQADPFNSPKQRLDRAKRHISEFEATQSAFIDSRPYERVIVIDDADGSFRLHKFLLTKTMPPALSQSCQDAIETLRHTLDQVGFAAAVLDGRPEAKAAYFPFSDTSANLANVIKQRCKHLPEAIVTLFRSYQPYKGGNDALWAMNKIAVKKHTAIEPVGTAVDSMRIKSFAISGGPAAINAPKWDREKQELVYARTGLDTEVSYDLEFSLDIAFGDVPVFAGQPVLSVLQHLSVEVENILAATESECQQIGLTP